MRPETNTSPGATTSAIRTARITFWPKTSPSDSTVSPVCSPIRSSMRWTGSRRCGGRPPVDGDSGKDRLPRAGEDDEEAVALRLDLDAAVVLDLGPHEGVVNLQDSPHRVSPNCSASFVEPTMSVRGSSAYPGRPGVVGRTSGSAAVCPLVRWSGGDERSSVRNRAGSRAGRAAHPAIPAAGASATTSHRPFTPPSRRTWRGPHRRRGRRRRWKARLPRPQGHTALSRRSSMWPSR